MAARKRVVVVDDNDLTMPGFVRAFDDANETDLVGALSHAEAMAWCEQWRDVDAVVLDAADERLDGDQFPGVAVARRIRCCSGPDRPVIIVVTGHYLHDGLRHRMAGAGADLFFYRRDLFTPERLVDVAIHPERYRRGVPRPTNAAGARALGIGEHARIDELVTYVDEQGLASALDPAKPLREDPRSRRWMRHRAAIAEASGLKPVNITTGDAPRNARWPSIRQLRRAWAWAARVERPYDPASEQSSDLET